MEDKESILLEYKKKKNYYSQIGKTIRDQLIPILKKSKVKHLPLLYRLKDRKSLEKKIQSNKYKELSDLTDIYGIRIVVFQNKEIDKVINLIEKNFRIDKENSIDKRPKNPTEFGYNSVHSIVSLKNESELYSNLKVEIQVRTVLQHAWAEFSHELGYKSEKDPTPEFLRDINRISALLEIGDKEFERLKNEIKRYPKKLTNELKEGIKIEINKTSLKTFLENNLILKNISSEIKKEFKINFIETSSNYSEIIERLNLLKIESINELEKKLTTNSEHFKKFVMKFFHERKLKEKITSIASNSPLFYLCHFIALEKGEDFYLNKYHSFGIFKIRTQVNLFEIYSETK